MTRDEMLQIAQPIVLGIDEVRAIYDGTKHSIEIPMAVTKGGEIHEAESCEPYIVLGKLKGLIAGAILYDFKTTQHQARTLYYEAGDVMYVRETWARLGSADKPFYVYKSDGTSGVHFLPPCTMPKTAARIFLRITSVRYEQREMLHPDTRKSIRVWTKIDNFERVYPDG